VILWLNPFSGLSGDMLLGALLDLGAPLDDVRRAVASTGLEGWELHAEQIDCGGIVATRAVVEVTDTASARPAKELFARVRQAKPVAVAQTATAAVSALALVEGRLHGQHPDNVHLHEIGGLDTVVDIVGVTAALHLLGIQQVYSAPVAVGVGTVSSHHGLLPAPAPATLALLVGAQVADAGVPVETVTPTGAALLRAVGAVFRPLPPMVVTRSGYGAGTRVLPDRPNVLQALIGTPVGAVEGLVVLETNVDDITGEVLGQLLVTVLAAGATDAWITPAIMKKGRPGHVVHVLTRPEQAAALEQLLFAETGTLGLRRTAVQRAALDRTTTTVEVKGRQVRVKLGPWSAKPEHDDLVAAAQALGLPLHVVAAQAQAAIDR